MRATPAFNGLINSIVIKFLMLKSRLDFHRINLMTLISALIKVQQNGQPGNMSHEFWTHPLIVYHSLDWFSLAFNFSHVPPKYMNIYLAIVIFNF